MTMKGPAYSFDYYATYDAAKDEFPSLSVSPQTHSVAVTPGILTAHGSYSSYNGFLGSVDPFSAGAYSTGNTPPVSSGFLARRSMDEVSHHSLSSSPEFTHHSNHSRKSTSAVNFAAGFARAFNTASSNSSPPNRRRPSPAESILHMATGTGVITWGQNTIIGSGSRGGHGGGEGGGRGTTGGSSILTATEEDDYEGLTDIKIEIVNSGFFDDEGMLGRPPLLNPMKAKYYRAYREEYANLLFAWDLQVRRLEVLKINGVKGIVDEEGEKLEMGTGGSGENFAKKTVLKIDSKWSGLGASTTSRASLHDTDANLLLTEIVGTCPKCQLMGTTSHTPFIGTANTPNKPPARSLQPTPKFGSTHQQYNQHYTPTTLSAQTSPIPGLGLSTPYSPVQKNIDCTHCKGKLKHQPLICVICQVSIKGLYGACLVCGHVAHSKCHRDWFCPDKNSIDESDYEGGRSEIECPAGCGCRCMDHAEDGFGFTVPPAVPPPPLNLPPPMMLNKQSFNLINKRMSAGGYQDRSGPRTPGGNYLIAGLDEEYFEDDMMDEDDEYDEEDEGMLGDEEEEPTTLEPNLLVHISEY